MDFSDTAVGIKTFKREEKLFRCLESLKEWNFKEVIVADDSKISDEKWDKYKNMKDEIPLKILDLSYKSGIGYGRNSTLEKTSAEYFLVLDDDMIPQNIRFLKKILTSKKRMGGVGPFIIENNNLVCGASDLFLKNGCLIKDIKNRKKVIEHPHPHFIFDWIPQTSLYKTKCLKEFGWDDKLETAKDHVDLFLNFYLKSDWKFSVTPKTVFKHFPGGSFEYKMRRKNKQKMKEQYEYLLSKWNLRDIVDIKKNFYGPLNIREELEIKIKRIMLFGGIRLIEDFKNKIRKWSYYK